MFFLHFEFSFSAFFLDGTLEQRAYRQQPFGNTVGRLLHAVHMACTLHAVSQCIARFAPQLLVGQLRQTAPWNSNGWAIN